MQRTLQRGLKVPEASAGTVEDDAMVQLDPGCQCGEPWGAPTGSPWPVLAKQPWASPELAV